MNEKVSNKALFDFCSFYRQQFGQFEDATRFRNGLGLRFYSMTRDSYGLFERCIERRFIKCECGNVVIRVGGNE